MTRGQRSEVRGQRTEGRGGKSDVGFEKGEMGNLAFTFYAISLYYARMTE